MTNDNPEYEALFSYIEDVYPLNNQEDVMDMNITIVDAYPVSPPRVRRRARERSAQTQSVVDSSDGMPDLGNDINARWKRALGFLAETYLRHIGKINGHASDVRDIDLPTQSVCGRQCTTTPRDVMVYFFHHADLVSINFCSCKPDAQKLMEMGLMPASPTKPRTAIHIGLMDYIIELRDSAALSGESVANLYNNWHRNYKVPLQKPLPAVICQKVLPLYLELQKNVKKITKEMAKSLEESDVKFLRK